MRVTIVGKAATANLESSYVRAFRTLDYDVNFFDIDAAVQSYARLGRIGRLINHFLPVDPWIRKANRGFTIAEKHKPSQLILVFTGAPVQPGALAQIKASSNCRFVLIWPDTLLNMTTNLIQTLPLYDLVATYSSTSESFLTALGAKRTTWLPLAGDPFLLRSNNDLRRVEGEEAEVSFIGGWRPEREEVLGRLTQFNLKIWGPDWGRRCRNHPAILQAWQGHGAYGEGFSRIVACSRINLNIIDPTNYPAANMRFFEIPTAGGFQLTSEAPEMADDFRDGEHLIYYSNVDELPILIARLLERGLDRARMAAAAHAQIINSHTYTHRVYKLLTVLEAI